MKPRSRKKSHANGTSLGDGPARKHQTEPEGNAKADGRPVGHTRLARLIISLGLSAIVIFGSFLILNAQLQGKSSLQLRTECQAAVNAQDWVLLEQTAREWAALEPDRIEPWSFAAAAARSMGDLQSCAAYLEQLPEEAPLGALLELSMLQVEVQKDPFKARQTLERAIKYNPKDRESSQRLLFLNAMLCDREGVRSEALRSIKNQADKKSSYAYYFSASWLTFSNGYAINQVWLEQSPSNEVLQVAAVVHGINGRDLSTLSNDGSGLSVVSEHSAADLRKQFAELYQTFPNNPELLCIQLSSLLQSGDGSAMAEILDRTRMDDCLDHRFWRFQGWYYSSQEQWEKSLEAYKRALELCPVDWASQNELAFVIRRTQGIDAAAGQQTLATEGLDLATQFLAAANFEVVADDLYRQLAQYFEKCGQQDLAVQLRRLL